MDDHMGVLTNDHVIGSIRNNHLNTARGLALRSLPRRDSRKSSSQAWNANEVAVVLASEWVSQPW